VRLVHLADLHLGFRQYHRLNADGLNQREADVARTFRRVVDRVIELRPELVVIGGDVFHTVRPMNPAIISAFIQFSRLRQALPDAVVVMVAGNHDRPRATETGCILRLFKQLGIHVVDSQPERLPFPERELSVLAVPDVPGVRPLLVPDESARWNVLLLHGEVEGMLDAQVKRGDADRAAIEISKAELGASKWSYVALGHYHVHREIAPNAYYSGSIDYTSTNPWGEMREEREAGLPGKGILEYDLETRAHRFHHVEPSRQLHDLPPLSAAGKTAAELDAMIREAAEAIPGGIDDTIARLVVHEVPTNMARSLDHRAIRELRRRAMHFHLDLRRPELRRISVSGAPGARRRTLPEIVEAFLRDRPLAGDVDREALVRLALEYLSEADAAAAAAPAPVAAPMPSA
jgi:DNA repair protein SbcD/Mre11